MTASFASLHFRNSALVDAQIRRNIVLEIASVKALPNDVDSFVGQSNANSRLFNSHCRRPFVRLSERA
jgi:hypothetical protein